MGIIGVVLIGVCCALAGGVVGAAWHRRQARRMPDLTVHKADVDVLAQEMERARRYERPLAMLWVDTSEKQVPFEAVSSALRLIDHAWADEHGIRILLPESRRDEGEACISRLVEAAPGLEPSDIRLAVFPDDGVTTGALFSHLVDEVELLPSRSDLPTGGPRLIPRPSVAS